MVRYSTGWRGRAERGRWALLIERVCGVWDADVVFVGRERLLRDMGAPMWDCAVGFGEEGPMSESRRRRCGNAGFA